MLRILHMKIQCSHDYFIHKCDKLSTKIRTHEATMTGCRIQHFVRSTLAGGGMEGAKID